METPPPSPAPRGLRSSLGSVRTELWLVLAAVAGSFLVYLPFRGDMTAVYRVWDGPNYLTVARTLYDVRPDNPLLAYVHETRYFLRHFPVYPLLIRLFSFVGWQQAMLLVPVASAALAAVLLFWLLRDHWKVPQPGWLALVFLFLPPRWLLYRSVGSSEAPFLALALGSLLLFEKGKVGRASLLAALATLTRIPGLMFLPAFGVVLLQRRRWRDLPWLGLIPLPLLGYFWFCFTKTGNFFEYFAQHADKISPPMPFGFVPTLFRAGWYHQVEFYILLALVYAVGTARLRGKWEVAFSYSAFMLLFHLFISVEDWSRYFLVFFPTALILGFHDLLSTREFKLIFPVFAGMSFVYAWGTIPILPCPPEMYAHLMWNLGLWKEFLPYLPVPP